MNAFAAIDLDPDDPAFFVHRAEEVISQPPGLEDTIRKYQWFDYRRMTALEATTAFVRAYNDAMLAMVRKNGDMPENLRDHIIRRRSYLNENELYAPWLNPKAKTLQMSDRWKSWISARRSADKRGMKYHDFCYGAVVAAFRRGWTRMPQPNMLTNAKLLGCDPNDRWPDATVQGYEAKVYKSEIKRAENPYYLAAAWAGEPEQIVYLRYLAREIVRVYGPTQRAKRMWTLLQSEGHIHASQSFDMLLT